MKHFAFFLASLACALPAAAQLTSGISGPVVKEGTSAVGYRVAYDADTNGLAQRIHYDRALSSRVLVRGVIQARKTDDSQVDFDSIQGELRWQITPDSAKWQQGLRLDLKVRDESRPGQLALHWLNQVYLARDVRARFTAIASTQTGDDRNPDVLFLTRGDIGRRLSSGVDIGAEIYNSYGAIDDILPLSQESHQVGPFVGIPLGKSLSMRTSVLVGLTEASPDVTFRLFLTQAL